MFIYKKLLAYPLAIALPLLPLLGFAIMQTAWLLPLVVFTLLFPITMLAGKETAKPVDLDRLSFGLLQFMRWVKRLHFVAYVFGFFTIFWIGQQAEFLDQVGLCVSLCVMSALAIVHMHESVHSLVGVEKMLTRLYAVFLGMGHFKTEHLFHHHKPGDAGIGYVAKPDQSLYSFVWSRLEIGIRYAFKLEGKILGRQSLGQHRSHILLNYASILCLAIFLHEFFGLMGLLGYLIQIVSNYFLYYTAQYVEHFGLTSDLVGEDCIEVAWEYPSSIESLLLLNASYPVAHQNSPFQPAFLQERSERSPQMPFNHGLMYLTAMVPPLFLSIMQPRLEGYRAQALA